ncbi:MAG: hypothetical protein ACLP7F_13215 [Acidimicrobiales bacterium]
MTSNDLEAADGGVGADGEEGATDKALVRGRDRERRATRVTPSTTTMATTTRGSAEDQRRRSGPGGVLRYKQWEPVPGQEQQF